MPPGRRRRPLPLPHPERPDPSNLSDERTSEQQLALLSRASLLLNQLLGQEISSLDFCFHWQELSPKIGLMSEVDNLVSRFLQTSELGALDRALALLPPRPPTAEMPDSSSHQDWRAPWKVSSRRLRETTYLDLKCRSCGWEITIAGEHAANTELRLPFEEFHCPECSP